MTNQTFLLLQSKPRGKRFARLNPKAITNRDQMRRSIASADQNTIWVSLDRHLTNALLKTIQWPPHKLGWALILHDLRVESIPALERCFEHVAYGLDKSSSLPAAELSEVLLASNRKDLFIGGTVGLASQTITLWRGDLTPITVPLSTFRPSAVATPDFSDFSVIDYGHALRFGDYEAATDSILYDFDLDYRRRSRKQLRNKDRSFGASLRRLRKQKGLSRDDFPKLTSKTIARIERGEVHRPHSRTISTIAKRLDVEPDEIESY